MPTRLDTRVPERGFSHPDEALGAFLDWVAEQGLTLYRHQEEAILEVFGERHVVLDAPTGSGKSLVAVAAHFRSFAALGRSWYTAPIKALVSEKFFALCAIFGPEHVGLITGDGALNRDAPILCCTAEILSNAALREGESLAADTVVMDEFHYYADRDRGVAWQIPLLTLPRARFLLMSATLGDTRVIQESLQARTGREVAEIKGAHRPVPLGFTYSLDPFHEAVPRLLREGRAPIYAVHFTQSEATEQAQALTSVELCTREEKRALAEAVRGFRFHSPFGGTVRRYVLHGVGLHHAGLLPRYRLLVECLAQQGLLKVICGTDTLGVGINVPIRTVLLTKLCKFDGEKVELLTVREFRQIAGRAGRAGYDTEGFVVVQAPAHVIENARMDARVTDPKKRRKLVRAQPPTRGYKHWDENTFQQLTTRPCEALQSRFRVDHGQLLALMQHAERTTGDAARGMETLVELIERSHSPANRKAELRTRAQALLDSLVRAGVAHPDGARLRLDTGLQRDFSLHHSLSLFLLGALASLDPQAADHALRVVSWVEAILEDPRPVLLAQVSRARTRLLTELKAAGVPFEEREALLEDLSWPKPHAEEVYAVFNAWQEHHPWVEEGAIRPKSVARELLEGFTSFADYVRELGIERSEGVLLRYLSDVYKALVQNVPQEHHTDALQEHIATLRATLATVDTSLLTEWERLREGADAPAAEARPLDISADRKAFSARVRAELHALLRALARGDWEEALACARPSERWDVEALQAALQPFIAEHGGVACDHAARLGHNTLLRPAGPHQWTITQVLRPLHLPADPDEEPETWRLEGHIDLREDTAPAGPLIELRSIGP